MRVTPHLGAAACGHPVTVAAAGEALRDGGNAFDAAVAAACAACVAEPVLASLAGGGFLLAWPAGRPPVAYDFFVQTPLRRANLDAIEFYPVSVDFGGVTQEFHIGTGAAATPGVVRGLFAIQRDLCRLPMPRLMRPAIDAARDGVAILPLQSYMMSVIAPILTATEEARRIYAGGGRATPSTGDVLRQPELANTFQALSREGEDWFHQGENARRIETVCREHGGQLTAAALARYRVEKRPPLDFRFRDARILTNPPPSTGGALVALALRLLEGSPAKDETERMARLARAMQLANKARTEAGAAELLAGELTARYQREANRRLPFHRGTTHISAIDRHGNAAALTLSNGEGCGRMVPGTGVMLNNMLGEADLSPTGWHRWAPDARVASMMAPTIMAAGEDRFVLGSGGSNRIRSAVLQTIERLADGMAVRDAVEAPRIHVEGELLSLEGGISAPVAEALEAVFGNVERWPEKNLFFGGVHVAGWQTGAPQGHPRFVAVGDARRGGAGVVVE